MSDTEPRCASCLSWKMHSRAADHPGVWVGQCYTHHTRTVSEHTCEQFAAKVIRMEREEAKPA